MKKLVITVLCALTLACGAKQMTREESLAMLKAVDEARTKVYYGHTQKEIILAAEKTLLAFDKDYSFAHTENGFVATIFNRWEVETSPQQDGILVQLKLYDGVFTMGGIVFSTDYHTSTALYQLFYSKLSFILGDSKELMSCAEVKRFGYYVDPLCTYGQDRVPEDANQPIEVINYHKAYREYLKELSDSDREWRGELPTEPVKPW